MVTKHQPGTRISEYLLEECVGSGTFGEVWQARHHIWSTERVAIKLPTEPEYVRYLQREGVVVHGLRHENIIRVIGLDPYCETPYLIMELVRGPALRQVLTEHPTGLPIEQVLVVLRGILGAMSAAHAANIIHRDLKPGNILLNLGQRPLEELMVADVKVGDFGLGVSNEETLRSMIEQSGSIERDQRTSAIAGTLAYMAPEIRDGRHAPDPRSDLYSVGVILYESLTGERPAGAELPSTLRVDTPAVLDDVFRRLYSRYENRYESADAVLLELEQGLSPAGAAEGGSGGEAATTAVGVKQRRGRVLVQCPACERPVVAGDQFCTHCGMQLTDTVRRCSACGGYPGPHDQFCIFCGAALPSEE